MAGRIMRVLPLRSFTFTDAGDGKTIKVTVARKIKAAKFSDGESIVRLHSATIPNFPAKLTVRVVQDPFTEEDPATEFQGESVAEVSFDSGDSDGSVDIAALDDNRMGTFIAIVVEAKQRSEGDTFTASISADVVLR